ncbi:hypothetical protein ACFU90_04155 [Streptomyces noursei]|uniref:hypothetical protein n=1 Tax=Streptomyces noursei TaxID=1971 RepID=UPI0035D5A185
MRNGWSCQVADRRAIERDEDAVGGWIKGRPCRPPRPTSTLSRCLLPAVCGGAGPPASLSARQNTSSSASGAARATSSTTATSQAATSSQRA